MNSNQEFLLHQINRYKYIMDNVRDIIWEMDKDLAFTFVSPNCKDMAGYEVEEIVGHKLLDFLTEDSRVYMIDQVNQHISKRMNGDMEDIILHDVEFVCKNREVIWFEVSANLLFEDGGFIGYIGTSRDITEKKEYECQLSKYVQELEILNTELEKTSTIDTLTGAYNRRKFEDDLDSLIDKKDKDNIHFSIIFFDIDHFKKVNDSFGHKKGDLVLQHIAELVIENLKESDSLYRWGGEEFIIILNEEGLENAIKVAEKIRSIISNYNFGINMEITISLGVTQCMAGENADQIISRLDDILYQAKLQGRNIVVY